MSMKFRRFGTMLDCSRNAVMKPDMVKKWIDLCEKMGHNTLMLYTEDTYELDGHPYFGHLRGKYSQAQLRLIDDHAAAHGIELIPCIQTLAHLPTIFQWDCYADVRDCNDILLADSEKTVAFIEDMFRTVSKTFRSKTILVGMDEAHMLGLGQYLVEHGYRERSAILVEHLNKVSQIAQRYDMTLLMWSDMFFRLLSGNGKDVEVSVSEEVRAMIPNNVELVHWDYLSLTKEAYAEPLRRHNELKAGTWFAGAAWCWTGLKPHNSFSMELADCVFPACEETGTENVIITLWGDDGCDCSRFTTLPAVYYASMLAQGITDINKIKQGFEALVGIAFDDFMLLDLPNTPSCVPGTYNNPEKYMLYADCFMGRMDDTVAGDEGSIYGAAAKKLRPFISHPQFGYLFDTMYTLSRVLEVKYTLGIRTRKAYLSNDRQALQELLCVYDETLPRVQALYEAFRRQWMKENNPQGFELQDIRLGGLKQRIQHCKDRLEAYLAGKLDRIEELEEPVLNHRGTGSELQPGSDNFGFWFRSACAGYLGSIL